jgi:hypothetical protein
MAKKAWLPVLAFLLTQPSAPQSPGFVEARGARVPLPAGWTSNDGLIAAGGPIALTNFGGAYTQGGFPPPGGAEIEIASVAAPPNLADYIRRELSGPGVNPLEEFTAGANSGIRASYLESLNADLSLKTVVDYVPRGSVLYKFYLTYWNGDRNGAAFEAIMTNVAGGTQFR